MKSIIAIIMLTASLGAADIATDAAPAPTASPIEVAMAAKPKAPVAFLAAQQHKLAIVIGDTVTIFEPKVRYATRSPAGWVITLEAPVQIGSEISDRLDGPLAAAVADHLNLAAVLSEAQPIAR